MTYNNANTAQIKLLWLLYLLLLLVVSTSCYQAEEWQTTGNLKYYLSQIQYDNNNIFSLAGTDSPIDQTVSLRLTAEKKLQGKWDTVIHYEMAAYHSDSLKAAHLLDPLSTMSEYGLPNDDARFINLTSIINNANKNALIHRLDRASVGYTTSNLVFRFGRQAVSWGNGMVFQPMDIFNPFSPTAVDKEYKNGDDMIYLQNLLDSGDDIQTVLIPRRNILTSDLETNESSLAIKYHSSRGDTDLDFLISRHFSNNLVAVGFAADWQGSIIRGDLVNVWNSTGTTLSAVVSSNYSWIWGKHNISGFLEYYHNGYGIDNGDYSPSVLANRPELTNRISRGEIFSLGRDYLSTGLIIELTPRWLFNPLLINNMNDDSFLTQWIVTFDWKQNLTLLLGANIPFGDEGTEYGGIPGTLPDTFNGGGRSVFLQLALYF